MPEKRDPYGENVDVLEAGCAWCDHCGGDGGWEHCIGFNHYRQEPDYEWDECSMCEGTGQVLTEARALELDRQKLEAMGADPGPSWREIDEETPF